LNYVIIPCIFLLMTFFFYFRYKIFIEGVAWSVSDKYILGCDSMTLLVKPKYFDFYTRSLVAKKHYWPISPTNLCKDIKSAVEWGNNNTDKVNLSFSSPLASSLFI